MHGRRLDRRGSQPDLRLSPNVALPLLSKLNSAPPSTPSAPPRLSAATFTDAALTVNTTKAKAVHITELRTALDAARAAIGLAAISYTNPTLTVQSTGINTAHVAELRGGVQ